MNEEKVHAMKEALFRVARKKHPDDKAAQNAFVFGILRKHGWQPKREREGYE